MPAKTPSGGVDVITVHVNDALIKVRRGSLLQLGSRRTKVLAEPR